MFWVWAGAASEEYHAEAWTPLLRRTRPKARTVEWTLLRACRCCLTLPWSAALAAKTVLSNWLLGDTGSVQKAFYSVCAGRAASAKCGSVHGAQHLQPLALVPAAAQVRE